MKNRMRIIFTFMVGVLVTSIFYVIIPMEFYSFVVGVFVTLTMMTAWEDSAPKKKKRKKEEYEPHYIWEKKKNDKNKR